MSELGPQVFESWAPEQSPWSAWAKPILFAWRGVFEGMAATMGAPVEIPDGLAAPTRAWIIDSEGSSAVRTGAALTRLGVQPVPLFNGVPELSHPAVETVPILIALRDECAGLAQLPADAPPCFLLDSRRMEPTETIRPGIFDNRWQVAPQDFPSARRMLEAHITEVVLVTDRVRDDLAHVLRRWQEGGIQLSQLIPGDNRLLPLEVPAPPWYRSAWWRVMVMAGLQANAAGGFGSLIPIPSENGGYG